MVKGIKAVFRYLPTTKLDVMRTKTTQFFGILALAVLFLTTTAFAPVPTDQARWEKLGSRKIKHNLDRDEILVTGWEGSFTALKLKVEKSDINLHKVVVYYRSGRPTTLAVKQTLRAGQETRVLNLPGRRRVINRVVFWYDTKGYERKKGKVELWGRK